MSVLATAILNGLSGGFEGYTQAKRDNRLNARLDKKDAREEDLYQRQLKAFDRADTNFERKDAYRRDSIKAFEDSTLSFPEDNEGNRAVGPAFKGQPDKGKYLRSMRALAGQSGDAMEMARIDKLIKLARQEGVGDLLTAIKMGDFDGGTKKFNLSGGRFKILPGSLKRNGNKVTWLNDAGEKVESTIADMGIMAGGKVKVKKGLMAFKPNDGLIDQDTNKVLREPGNDKVTKAKDNKDLFTLSDGSVRSMSSLLDQFKVEKNVPSEYELLSMTADEQASVRERVAGEFPRWAKQNFNLEFDGGATAIRKKSAIDERDSTFSALVESDDIEGFAKERGLNASLLRSDFEQWKAQRGIGVNTAMKKGLNPRPPINTPEEAKIGKENNRIAMSYTKVANYVKNEEGEPPSPQALMEALTIAENRKDTYMAGRINIILKRLSEKS